MSDIPSDIIEAARNIRLIITDIDGVMTDGGIIYDNSGMEIKKFNVKDGLGVKHVRQNKVLVGAITGRASKVVERRCEELNFDFHYHGVKDKGKRFEDVLDTLMLKPGEVAYIGDDLIDLPILMKAGLAVAPADAVEYIKPRVHYITKASGGQGVFREVVDIILFAQDKLVDIYDSYTKYRT